MANYYLHRISYKKDISYPLLDKENYLSIGFGVFLLISYMK